MQWGKPSGARCIHLDDANLCSLWGSTERPGFCARFSPSLSTCGTSQQEAMKLIDALDRATAPSRPVHQDSP